MGRLTPENRKKGVSDLHWAHKQIENAMVKVGIFADAGIKCGVLEFEEIGT